MQHLGPDHVTSYGHPHAHAASSALLTHLLVSSRSPHPLEAPCSRTGSPNLHHASVMTPPPLCSVTYSPLPLPLCFAAPGLAGLQAALIAPQQVRGVQLMNISLRGLHTKRMSPLQRPLVAALQAVLRGTQLGQAFFGSVAKPQVRGQGLGLWWWRRRGEGKGGEGKAKGGAGGRRVRGNRTWRWMEQGGVSSRKPTCPRGCCGHHVLVLTTGHAWASWHPTWAPLPRPPAPSPPTMCTLPFPNHGSGRTPTPFFHLGLHGGRQHTLGGRTPTHTCGGPVSVCLSAQAVKNILGQAYARKEAVNDELVDCILKPGLQVGQGWGRGWCGVVLRGRGGRRRGTGRTAPCIQSCR
jgi:hypothetical protein